MDYATDDVDETESEDEGNVGRRRKRNSSVATFDTITKRPRLPTREPEAMDFAPIELDILGDPLLEDNAEGAMQPGAEDHDVELPDLGEPSSFE